jgi:signal transduction histidine kinase
VQEDILAGVYFIYGLAFFSMGLVISLEVGRGADIRLRRALRPLAGFGLIHGIHEWLEMFERLDHLPLQAEIPEFWAGVKLALLAFSFLSLAAFGGLLLAKDEQSSRLWLLLPLVLASIWAFGALVLRSEFPYGSDLMTAAQAWTRYILAVPSSLLASAGLIFQQREFRRTGMAQFGRDSLWAAIAFTWYGLIGQVFTQTSRLVPSNVINQELFMRLFGFPIQLLRAAAAVMAAIFVMRFLRSFEVAIQRQISDLQAARLEEAQRREALHGDMLRRIVAAQEAERQRIARELHDQTGQDLTAIGLGLRGAATILRQDTNRAASNLRQLEGLVAHSLQELQRLIADLRPSHLDDLGLAAALRWYAGEVQKRVPLLVSVEVRGEPRQLSSEMKTALFRVAQEAITNVIKHANASNVKVLLEFGEHGVSVQVEDDGQGFDIHFLSSQRRPSWGLLGMEERAALLGGEFLLNSHPGQGTQVQVTIPYPQGTEVKNADPIAASR